MKITSCTFCKRTNIKLTMVDFPAPTKGCATTYTMCLCNLCFEKLNRLIKNIPNAKLVELERVVTKIEAATLDPEYLLTFGYKTSRETIDNFFKKMKGSAR